MVFNIKGKEDVTGVVYYFGELMRVYKLNSLKGSCLCIIAVYYTLRLVNENHSSSKTAFAAEILDFFLDFLKEIPPNVSKSLSGAPGTAASAGSAVVSSTTPSDASTVRLIGITDSIDVLDASSELLDS